ncbi:hypothetical protein YC2023_017668 [Brassica napus]
MCSPKYKIVKRRSHYRGDTSYMFHLSIMLPSGSSQWNSIMSERSSIVPSSGFPSLIFLQVQVSSCKSVHLNITSQFSYRDSKME